MLYLTVLLGFVFFAGIAMTVNEGVWSNLIAAGAVLAAGVAGMFFGAPLGKFALEKSGTDVSFTWYFLFAGVWLTFFVVIVILRILFDRASKVRVRFIPQIDKFLGPVFGLLVATLFTSLLACTLLYFPVAGEAWNFDDGPEWSRNYMMKAATPFNSIIKRIERAENVDIGV